MQLLKINFDGTEAAPLSTMQQNTPKGYVTQAKNASAENDGYLVICGTSLDAEEPSERTTNIVAISGIVKFNNLSE